MSDAAEPAFFCTGHITMAPVVITIKDVNKTYGAVHAVNNLSFEVEQASCFGLLGPNGAGKSTMMKMIYAKCARDSDCDGSMDIFGYEPATNELEIKYLAGVVPQDNNLDEELNVSQNLLIYSRFYAMQLDVAKDRIAELLDFLELSDKAKCQIKELSGGMQRRLVIARALLNNPRLLILDEPTTGLDPQVRHLIWDKLRQLKKQGTTILLTTHYMEEAFQISDKLVIMHQGESIMQGDPKSLLAENVERYVLEIQNSDAKTMQGEIEGSELLRVDDSGQILRLFSDDSAVLRSIADKLDSSDYHLRQTNLEDLFLKATGRTLGVRQ